MRRGEYIQRDDLRRMGLDLMGGRGIRSSLVFREGEVDGKRWMEGGETRDKRVDLVSDGVVRMRTDWKWHSSVFRSQVLYEHETRTRSMAASTPLPLPTNHQNEVSQRSETCTLKPFPGLYFLSRQRLSGRLDLELQERTSKADEQRLP